MTVPYRRILASRQLWLGAGAGLLLLFLIRTAWCSEDGYIGFRVVNNFLAGHGLTWNVGERVQNYTDPLFELLLIAVTAVTGDEYWSSILLSLALSLGAYLVLMAGRPKVGALLGTAILLSSRGFMDYSVSGLENPATHAAIACYLWAYWGKRDPFVLTLIAALAAVNRMDSVLLFAPSLLLVYYRSGWRAWKAVLLGGLPFVAWELFSLFYYGFLFPNTAYAKLNTGLPQEELTQHGLLYLQNAAVLDVVTVLTILAGIAIGLARRDRAIALGALLSLVYVVRVGGDYMASRFLTPAFFLCCGLVLQHLPKKPIYGLAVCAVVLVSGLRVPHPALLTTRDYGKERFWQEAPYLGVTDERAATYLATGLLRWHRGGNWPEHFLREQGLILRAGRVRFAQAGTAGILPYFAGPDTYFFDPGALGDALTARLPMRAGPWRVGHYFRDAPAGYLETLATGQNRIEDKGLAEYYDHLRDVIRGEMWSVRRWNEIVAFHLGRYDHLLPEKRRN